MYPYYVTFEGLPTGFSLSKTKGNLINYCAGHCNPLLGEIGYRTANAELRSLIPGMPKACCTPTKYTKSSFAVEIKGKGYNVMLENIVIVECGC